MSVFDFAKSTLSSVLSNTTSFSSATSGLMFSVGAKYHANEGIEYSSGASSLWTLHHGTKRDDSSAVTVFIFEKAKNESYLVALARNALKRAKTIRYPDALRFIDGTETDTQIIIGTEYCEPLSLALQKDKQRADTSSTNLTLTHTESLKTLGLYKIATTLKFLTKDCGMIHGHVGIHSVFCTKAGEYKLAGFELLCSVKEEGPIFSLHGSSFYSKQRLHKYLPPEFAKSWPNLSNIPIHSVDAWAYGCLIHELFVGSFSNHDELLMSIQQAGGSSGSTSHSRRGSAIKTSRATGVPAGLVPFYKAFLNSDPARRLEFGIFLDKASVKGRFFDTDFISTSLFLENMALKDKLEKDNFIKNVHDKIDQFPINFSKYKILPELVKALEYGGAGTKALTPILKISGDLSQEEFEIHVNPVLLRLFTAQDRAIRVALCDHIHLYIQHFSPKIVSDKIFPNLMTGFSDTSAIVRESSLKSILHIAPKLNEKILNNDLLRILAKLQADEEPGIRTNTTICLGKLTAFLNEDVKKKILITAFLRSLKDPFPPARTAGLMAIGATLSYIDATNLAQRVLPAVSPLLIDAEKTVRVQASKNVELFVKKIEQHASSLPDTAMPPPSSSGSADKNGADKASGSSLVSSAAVDTFGWAVSAMSSKLTTLAVGGTDSSRPSSTAPPSLQSSSSRGSDTAKQVESGFSDTKNNNSPISANRSNGAMKLTPSSSMSFSTPSNSGTGGGLKLSTSTTNGWNNASGWDDDWDSPTKPETKPLPANVTPVGFGNTSFSSTSSTAKAATPSSSTTSSRFAAPPPSVNTSSKPASGWDFDSEWDSPTATQSAPISSFSSASTKPPSTVSATKLGVSSTNSAKSASVLSNKLAAPVTSNANNGWGDWNDDDASGW